MEQNSAFIPSPLMQSENFDFNNSFNDITRVDQIAYSRSEPYFLVVDLNQDGKGQIVVSLRAMTKSVAS